MEVVYILIFIVLNITLTFFLIKWNKKVSEINENVSEATKNLDCDIKNAAKILNTTAKASLGYKKFAYFKENFDKIKALISAVNLLRGKKSNKKFSILPILRKILFFI